MIGWLLMGAFNHINVSSNFSIAQRSHLTVVCFLGGLGGSCLLLSLTAQLNWTIPSFDKEGRPSMASAGLSATYNLVWRCFEH